MIKEFISYWNPLIIIFMLLFFLISWNSQNKFTSFLLKYFRIFFIVLIFPIVFMSFLYIFNNKNIGSRSNWFGFLGGYFGVIGAIGGIWWQLNEGKKREQLGQLKISHHFFSIAKDRTHSGIKAFISFKNIGEKK